MFRIVLNMLFKLLFEFFSTIAPRNLNKIKLKEIIQFQVEKYSELMKQFNDVRIKNDLKFTENFCF
jgi:hypothetical protein